MIKRRPSFDCCTGARLQLLKILQDKEMDNGELAAKFGKSRAATYWHLQMLLSAGLISRQVTKKNCYSPKAAGKAIEIIRFALTLEGKEALQFFG